MLTVRYTYISTTHIVVTKHIAFFIFSYLKGCWTDLRYVENEEGYVLRYYNMCSENVRVPESQHLFLDLLERPYPVHRGLISPQEIRTEFIKKEEI